MNRTLKLAVLTVGIFCAGCASGPIQKRVVHQQPLSTLTNMVEVGIDRSYKFTNTFGGTNGQVISNNFSSGGEVTLVRVPVGSMGLVPTLLGQPAVAPTPPPTAPPQRRAFQPYSFPFTSGINP